MKTKTIQALKDKLEQAQPGCCFNSMELLLLRSLLPKQEYEEGEKIMISCALPVLLIKLVKSLVDIDYQKRSISLLKKKEQAFLISL